MSRLRACSEVTRRLACALPCAKHAAKPSKPSGDTSMKWALILAVLVTVLLFLWAGGNVLLGN